MEMHNKSFFRWALPTRRGQWVRGKYCFPGKTRTDTQPDDCGDHWLRKGRPANRRYVARQTPLQQWTPPPLLNYRSQLQYWNYLFSQTKLFLMFFNYYTRSNEFIYLLKFQGFVGASISLGMKEGSMTWISVVINLSVSLVKYTCSYDNHSF